MSEEQKALNALLLRLCQEKNLRIRSLPRTPKTRAVAKGANSLDR